MAKLPRQNTMSKNPKLQDDIDRNLKLRDGALRILTVAVNTIQRLDAAKTILVSNSRLVVSMQQLQREKTNEANAAVANHADCIPTPLVTSVKHFCTYRATLCLSGVRIPLLWKDTSLTPNASLTLSQLLDSGYQWASATASGHFSTLSWPKRPLSTVLSMTTAGALTGAETAWEACSAFCIVRVGDQIRETRLLCEVHPGTADLEFDDVLTFENVLPDFECIIEIYGYQSSNGQGVNSFLRRRSQMDFASISHRNSVFLGTLTPEYAKDSKTGQRVSISSNAVATDCCFTLVARYTAKIADLGQKVTAHPLDLLSGCTHAPSASSSPALPTSGTGFSFSSTSAFPVSENVLPLFGPICFSLTARPDSVHNLVRSGLMWIRTLNASPKPKIAKLYLCELRNQRLYAKLVKPNERSTLSPDQGDRSNTSETRIDVKLRKGLNEIRRPRTKWNLLIKVDPDVDVLDAEPTYRLMPLSLEALTSQECEYLLSSSRRLSRMSLSLDSIFNLAAPDMASGHCNGGDGSGYSKDDFHIPVSRTRGLEERLTTSPTYVERRLATLRFISALCGEKVDKVVFELAVFDPLIFSDATYIEDCSLLSDWRLALREHIEEQVKWGVEAFGDDIPCIPEATSLTKHGTIIKASTIPDIPTSTLEVLQSPILEEATAPPITAL